MTLKRWLGFLALGAVAVTIALGLAVIAIYADLRTTSTEHNDAISPSVVNASDLHSGINDLERGLRTYANGGSSVYRALAIQADTRNQSLLAELRVLTGDIPAMDRELNHVRDSYELMSANVVEPVLELADQGDFAQAWQALNARGARLTFEKLLRDTEHLRDVTDTLEQASYDETGSGAQRLAIAIFAATLALVAGPLVTWALVTRGVIKPLVHVQSDIRAATHNHAHDQLIRPVGRPEIRALAEDAETMRRQLVAEIDAAAAARQALIQEGPVVEAIRHELATRTTPDPADVEVVGEVRAAEGVLAGDFWDTVATGDGRVAITICDVTGHGAAAGIHALRIKTTLALGLVAGYPIADIMARCADDFDSFTGHVFASLAIVLVDPQSNQIEWVTAGHPPPRIVSPDGTITRLARTGPIVSALGGTWTSQTMSLPTDCVMVLFTDGLLESRDDEGSELGETGVDELLSALASSATSSTSMMADLIAHGRHRAVDWERDDVTVVAARVTTS